MKKTKLFICFLCFAIIGCNGQDNKTDTLKKTARISFEEKQKRDIPNIISETKLSNPDFNFRAAAKKVTPAVVYIKSTYSNTSNEYSGSLNDDFWHRFFFGGDQAKAQSEASGVLVSSDGFIVTNHHVIEDAETIEIILQNQKSYMAKIIGIDNETDMALLKIEERNLPFVEFGNSDEIEVGDWVLAVGNPFNLTSTVTAGIVSAKARNINILKEKGAVESYIQTDAAINPGNSGSALVDYYGKLVGINSAIASPTGAYAGYSFATPINIVKKIINDLLLNGKVQRGYLGVTLNNMSSDKAKILNTDMAAGVYIDSIIDGGAAMEAELKLNDVITAVDHRGITTSSQLKEMIEQHRPGEKIILTIIRKGKEKIIPLTLKEFEGTGPKSIAAKTEMLIKLGIKVEELSEKEKKRIKLSSGLRIIEIAKGKISNYTIIKKGFIITKVNGKPVNTEDEFLKAFENRKGIVMLEGIYPRFSEVYYFAFGID